MSGADIHVEDRGRYRWLRFSRELKTPNIKLFNISQSVAQMVAKAIENLGENHPIRIAFARQYEFGGSLNIYGVTNVADLGPGGSNSTGGLTYSDLYRYQHSLLYRNDRGEGSEVIFQVQPRPLDQRVRTNFWTEMSGGQSLWQAFGFKTADAALAFTILHELVHALIAEKGGSFLGGHADVLSRFADPSQDISTLGAGDVLNGDVDFYTHELAKAAGLFSDDGSQFLQQRASRLRGDEGVDLLIRLSSTGRDSIPETIGKILANRHASSKRGSSKLEMAANRAMLVPLRDPADPSVIVGYAVIEGVIVQDELGEEIASVREIGRTTFLFERNSDGSLKRFENNSVMRIGETVEGEGLSVQKIYSAGVLVGEQGLLEGQEAPEIVSSNIKLDGFPIEFSQAGAAIGQQLGYRLAGANVVKGVGLSAVT